MKKLWLLLGAVVILGLVVCAKPNGAIEVKSTPEGAAIYLDGDDTDEKTNTILADLEPGDYTVKLTLDGHDDYSKDVTVEGGDTVTVEAVLVANAFGALQVNSTPEGAAIELDGTATGETTNFLFDSLAVGSHTLKLTLDLYEDWDSTITIVKDETLTVEVELKMTTGSIQVNSTPTGAAIWIDDVNTGELTDYTFTDVEVGDYVVKLTLDGYADWDTTVTVNEDETATIDATLEEAPQEEITLIEDEADPSGGWGLALRKKDHKMAVKFTPPAYPFEITAAIYMPIVWNENQEDWQDPGDLVFFSPDMQGYPGNELGRKQFSAYEDPSGWNEFDVSDLDITINSGSFFFAIECIKDYGSVPGYPGTMLDFAKSVHHVSWAYTTFTNPDSTWDGWLPFDEFSIGSPDWPEDMTAGDSVDLILRVKGLVPGGAEVTLMPTVRHEVSPGAPRATLSADHKYEVLDWRELR